MAIDLPTTLRVLSHELRSPANVLQGYIRMLKDGHVDQDMQASILERLQRAGERIGRIAQQTSDLFHWTSADAPSVGPASIPIDAVVAQVESRAAETMSLVCSVASQCRNEAIQVSETGGALVDAFVVLARTVAREHGTAVAAAVRPATHGQGVDVCFFPVPPSGRTEHVVAAPRVPLAMDRGGQAMDLFVAAAVVTAHHGLVWQYQDGSMIGVTLDRGRDV